MDVNDPVPADLHFREQAEAEYSLVKLLGDLVVLHEPRRRPHHAQDAVGDPVGVEAQHR